MQGASLEHGVMFEDLFDFEDPQYPPPSGENNNASSSSQDFQG